MTAPTIRPELAAKIEALAQQLYLTDWPQSNPEAWLIHRRRDDPRGPDDAAARYLSMAHVSVSLFLAHFSGEIERLEGLVYAPGLWKCAKCNFTLIQSNLNAADGSVTARDKPGDKCPNCDSPLWRVSEREAGKNVGESAERYFEEAQSLKAELAKRDAREIELCSVIRQAEVRFREYGDLHAAKPDMVKAQRNYDMADLLRAALAPQSEDGTILKEPRTP